MMSSLLLSSLFTQFWVVVVVVGDARESMSRESYMMPWRVRRRSLSMQEECRQVDGDNMLHLMDGLSFR